MGGGGEGEGGRAIFTLMYSHTVTMATLHGLDHSQHSGRDVLRVFVEHGEKS